MVILICWIIISGHKNTPTWLNSVNKRILLYLRINIHNEGTTSDQNIQKWHHCWSGILTDIFILISFIFQCNLPPYISIFWRLGGTVQWGWGLNLTEVIKTSTDVVFVAMSGLGPYSWGFSGWSVTLLLFHLFIYYNSLNRNCSTLECFYSRVEEGKYG